MANIFYLSVSPPRISLSSPILPVFAGSTLTLECNTQLRIEVGSGIEITATWTRNETVLVGTATRMVSDVVAINGTNYLSQLIFNPLRLGLDDGLYICEARVEPNTGFVLGSVSQSNSVSLQITGKS